MFGCVLALGLTEIKDAEMKRAKCEENKLSYIRKSMGLLLKGDRLVPEDRKEVQEKKKCGILIFMFFLVSVVIDGYPVTKHQMNLLEARSIIPMVIFELSVPSKEIFKRLLLEKENEQR